MDVREFDFDLPSELIAQEPPPARSGARLLCLGRASGALTHTQVTALPELLLAGDLVVVNNTRVFPARLLGRRAPTGGSGRVSSDPAGRSDPGSPRGLGGAGASRAEIEAGRADDL
jgi:S-adenosylmethionine:tRNA ribosyltransferase-isomerase